MGIEHLYGGSGAADVNIAPADLNPSLLPKTGKGDGAGGPGKSFLDEDTFEQHAAIVSRSRALLFQKTSEPIWRPGDADVFQDGKCLIDDQDEITVRQRWKPTAREYRTPRGRDLV